MNNKPYPDDYEQASEHLRLALELLARHKVPPSPFNYRIGYDCVAGNHNGLTETLQETLSGPGPLQEKLWALYHATYVQDEEALETLRSGLREIIHSVQRDFQRSGENLNTYIQSLNRFSDMLDGQAEPGVMASEVNRVLEETRSTEQCQLRVSRELSQVNAEVESLRRELEQVREESMTDSLTGVSNRKAFDNMLEHTVHAARETGMNFCVMLIDIDHFKQVNDTYGHLVGDKVLRFTATTIRRLVRGENTVARYGGEEFALILPETDMAGANAAAERIRQTVSAGELKDRKGGDSYGRITVSIGISSFISSDLPHELIERADRALYLAKEHGRNRVEVENAA